MSYSKAFSMDIPMFSSLTTLGSVNSMSLISSMLDEYNWFEVLEKLSLEFVFYVRAKVKVRKAYFDFNADKSFIC